MARLTRPLSTLAAHYEVVVIGSGYGGSVAASRFARAGRHVCLLERGREFASGEFPDSPLEAAAEFQSRIGPATVGRSDALFDLHPGEDISVLVGCGLGGGSLINAAVAVRPDPRIFEAPAWPEALRRDVAYGLAAGFSRAEQMLRPIPWPDVHQLPKFSALAVSAESLGGRCVPAPVAIDPALCNGCGDCVAGCNLGAKRTTVHTYLADAVQHGAELYAGAEVRSLQRQDGAWQVNFSAIESGRERFDAPTLTVTANVVILAAGSLGSTAVLLRSQAQGLPLSPHLGERFTGNGDAIGYAYNADQPVNGIGRAAPVENPPGPCIAGMIDLRGDELESGIVIEDGALPSAMAPLLPAAFAGAAALLGEDTDADFSDGVGELAREWQSTISGAYAGAVHHTQTFLVMGHDDAGGCIRLDGDRISVRWPDVGEQPVFQRIDRALQRSTRAIGGTYIRNPLWTEWLERSLITVHPLGGCPMGEDVSKGVVDHRGEVFSRDGGRHTGLYVMDGAVMPRSLGVNPLLTIAAMAERNCAILARERGWAVAYGDTGIPAPEPITGAPSLAFTETMRGHFALDPDLDYAAAEAHGVQTGRTIEFTVTVHAEPAEMLFHGGGEAQLFGTVSAPAIWGHPLSVHNGRFRLFDVDPDRVGERRMRYDMPLTGPKGRSLRLVGVKRLHDDPGLDLWADTTTLWIDLEDGGRRIGRGALHIRPDDFARQLGTLRVTGTDDAGDRLALMARFGRHFAGSLFEIYGGVAAPPARFDPDARARKRRTLRAPAPTIHPVTTEDGVTLRLIRYRGGSRGPVLCLHGLGVSSRIFRLDTVDTNLVEALVAEGFDVWLLDYRASIELPAAQTPFDADSVARYDHPAAVDTVRRLTGAEAIDVVAHCFGATTFTMAMLNGLQGVRSAVISQVATHVVAPTMTRLKAGLHLPDVLQALGIERMSAYTDAGAGAWERLWDRALGLQPLEWEERCRSAVCHRVSFLYGLLYEHDQLNTATHDTLHELFGVVNLKAMAQLAEMVNAGRLVDFEGQDVYLPHVERLAIPITFIHGAENQCYLPESTERSFRLLCEVNGPERYRRKVIPGYGHIDCILGRNAARDVYPWIVGHLKRVAGESPPGECAEQPLDETMGLRGLPADR